eukprot:SM000049S16792  [mRNA]  locus=s49:671225:673023:- [translate_table: standard]
MSWRSSGRDNDTLVAQLESEAHGAPQRRRRDCRAGRRHCRRGENGEGDDLTWPLALELSPFSAAENGIVSSARVAATMRQVDRADFVQPGGGAYEDSPQLIGAASVAASELLVLLQPPPLRPPADGAGYNATISAPHMHGYCLSLLADHLQPGMRVLDVGSGSGYLTAIMALLVGEKGRVVGVEHIPELVERSLKAISKGKAGQLLENGSLTIHLADGRLGHAQDGPYHAIHVGAAAAELPQELVDQLRPGGRMVVPVGSIFQDLEVVDKEPDGTVRRHSAMGVRYVPLTARDRQLANV